MRRAEESLAIMLPAAVRARLLQENGGEIEADGDVWELFPVEDSTDRKRISRTANHIVRETEKRGNGRSFQLQPSLSLRMGQAITSFYSQQGKRQGSSSTRYFCGTTKLAA